MSNLNAMLSLFKEQLENESKALATAHSLKKRGDYLIWWYFRKFRGFATDEVQDVLCDDGSDLGIDAIEIDDDNVVHFYQFKNPENAEAGFPAGDVDKVIGGLSLILARKHQRVANERLRKRIEEIYQAVPDGYRLHLVISGCGPFPVESKDKLDAFVASLGGPPDSFLWTCEDLKYLQDAFYTRNLPTVSEPISFQLEKQPYMVRSAAHDCFMFHLSGIELAKLYDQHGEQLLQQNIRVDQGDSTTNNSILDSCIGEHAANFFHYNNGVTFLCETAGWDPFTSSQKLTKAQVVNGGQTMRVLHRSFTDSLLKREVIVPVRVITSQGDKEFAGNVAVNLNNQNRMESSFLRSNNPKVIQLGNSMASMGWYLERRDGEVGGLTAEEREKIEKRIGRKLDGAVVNLKEGTQAYVATFYGQPELAKKNPGKMFQDVKDGGHFDRIFSNDMSAEKFVIAQQIQWSVNEFVKQFAACKRRKAKVPDWRQDYKTVLTPHLIKHYGDELDQVIPQSAVFLCAVVFKQHVCLQGTQPAALLEILQRNARGVLGRSLSTIIRCAHQNRQSPEIANKSWPTLLKSQSFFDSVSGYGQKASKTQKDV